MSSTLQHGSKGSSAAKTNPPLEQLLTLQHFQLMICGKYLSLLLINTVLAPHNYSFIRQFFKLRACRFYIQHLVSSGNRWRRHCNSYPNSILIFTKASWIATIYYSHSPGVNCSWHFTNLASEILIPLKISDFHASFFTTEWMIFSQYSVQYKWNMHAEAFLEIVGGGALAVRNEWV